MFGIQMADHNHLHGQNRFAVIPTAEKLNANIEFSGRGVTLAFLDSGFYPHPDFAERIIAFHDISGEEKSLKKIKPQAHHWHGTQTVAAAAGNGRLSNGIYRGLAFDADLVLVKVSKKGSISDRNIEKGLEWIIENREKYNIRVLNLSLGADQDSPSKESRINQLTGELVKLGVVVVAAAGNSGEMASIPPANSPSVITVGGYSDENQFESGDFELYHSNFGETIDGIVKPEVIAPAMYVAAPILPGSDEYERAEKLSLIANAPEYAFRKTFLENWERANLHEYILSTDIETARRLVEQEVKQRKIVSIHYQHVDGTSFAAPIAASLIAQMLEANPGLTPLNIKGILISSASRLSDFPAIRQGFGVLNASLAIEEAISEMHFFEHEAISPPYIEAGKIIFLHHEDNAESLYLAGDFNDWNASGIPFKLGSNGLWRAELPLLPKGKYLYKFVINGERWIEDSFNGRKQEDSFGGFNSILQID